MKKLNTKYSRIIAISNFSKKFEKFSHDQYIVFQMYFEIIVYFIYPNVRNYFRNSCQKDRKQISMEIYYRIILKICGRLNNENFG